MLYQDFIVFLRKSNQKKTMLKRLMKNILTYGIVSLFILGLFSCASPKKEKLIFSQEFYFKNGIWNRFQKDSFEFQITNLEARYDVIAEVEHNKKTEMEYLPITICFFAPDQSSTAFQASIPFVNAKGHFIGRENNGWMAINKSVMNQRTFSEKGCYKIVFNQTTSIYDLLGIRSIKFTVLEKPVQN